MLSEFLFMILGAGASPLTVDGTGVTPLDLALQNLQHLKMSNMNEKSALACMQILVLFTPKTDLKTKLFLQKDSECWTSYRANYSDLRFP